MIVPSLRSQGDPVYRNLTPLTAPMKLREETQDLWADHIVLPMYHKALYDDKATNSERFVAMTSAVLTTVLNPSMIQISALTTHGVRHRRAYASHYRALKFGPQALKMGLIGVSRAAQDYSFYKHYLKKPLVPLTARIGSRVIPVLGWALLAHDFYTLATKGKFMGFNVR